MWGKDKIKKKDDVFLTGVKIKKGYHSLLISSFSVKWEFN